jgi:hypothetical protein
MEYKAHVLRLLLSGQNALNVWFKSTAVVATMPVGATQKSRGGALAKWPLSGGFEGHGRKGKRKKGGKDWTMGWSDANGDRVPSPPGDDVDEDGIEHWCGKY